MSKQGDRVHELTCELAIAILTENGIDDFESYMAFKAGHSLMDNEEHARIKLLRDQVWKILWLFSNDENPRNLSHLALQIDRIRSLE